MKVLITLPLILLAILPAICSFPWTGLQGFQQSQRSTVKQPTGTFGGCYSDTSSQILGNSGVMFESDTNINANCAIACKEKGFTVASTNGHTCYCTNALPYPQLFPANDSRAAGKSGPCDMTCPGAWTEDDCQSDECCGGEGAYSVFIVERLQMTRLSDAIMQQENEPKRHHFAQIQEIAKFDGCYSDEQANVLGGVNGMTFTWNDNYNVKCQAACKEEGYAIASTKGKNCYCTNSLPIPQVYRADNRLSAGHGGPCSTVCPGVFATHSCQGDECCGGENAASVYIVGEIDALKQLQRRVIDRVLGSSRARSQILGDQQLKYYIKDQWKTEMNGGECQLKSEVSKHGQIDLKYEISSQLYKDYNNIATSIQTQQQLNRLCTYEHVRYTLDFGTGINVYELNTAWVYVIGENSAPVYYDTIEPWEWSVQPGSGWSKFVLNIHLPPGTVAERVAGGPFGVSSSRYGYGTDKCNRGRVPKEVILETVGSCPVIEGLPIGVSVAAMGQTATNTGVGSMKVYNLTKLNKGETLTQLPLTQSPFRENESTGLTLVAMEKLIESEEQIKEEPLSNWDIACDNLFGSTSQKCRKIYSETTGFTQSWTTEHGLDLSVTIGSSFEASVLFAKVSTSLEISFGYSFTKRYTKSKELGVSEQFWVEGDVPPRSKVEIRFFKSDVPVRVKWRASLFAQGYVLVAFVDPVTGYPLMDKPKLLHLAQLLSYDERRLFAFGTIDYGKRTTLISRTKIVDRDGNVISSNEENKPVNAGTVNP